MRSLVLILVLTIPAQAQSAAQVDPGFVSVVELDSTIVVDARYYGDHNFVGRPIAGYEAPKCLLTREAAVALVRVQADLRLFGLGLRTYDCYRPQRAVDHFVTWARDRADTKMKAEFYPAVAKTDLFRDGYIAERSGHSRGSTIDLTLVPLPALLPHREVPDAGDCRTPDLPRFGDDPLDMGTAYDCFDPLSHTANPTISANARRNRLLLKTVMEKQGFTNYVQEWWHFTLRREPYPDQYFDVPVR